MYWRWFVNQGEPRALRLGLFFLRIDARCLSCEFEDFEVNAASRGLSSNGTENRHKACLSMTAMGGKLPVVLSDHDGVTPRSVQNRTLSQNPNKSASFANGRLRKDRSEAKILGFLLSEPPFKISSKGNHDFLGAAVVELRRAGAGMVRHLRRLSDLSFGFISNRMTCPPERSY